MRERCERFCLLWTKPKVISRDSLPVLSDLRANSEVESEEQTSGSDLRSLLLLGRVRPTDG
jgi:hypothetical protein